MAITYRLTETVTARLEVALEDVRSRWKLSLTNVGAETVTLLPVFPCLDGVALPEKGHMLGVN